MPIAPDCMASLPTRPNATCSGIAGTVKRPDTNARPVWPTIVRLASVCGPIRFQNAEMKVCDCAAQNLEKYRNVNWLTLCRSCQRFRLSGCRWDLERRLFLATCSPWRLPQILHLPGRSCPRIRLPDWNRFQDWRRRRHRKLWRSRRCSRMVSTRKHFLVAFSHALQIISSLVLKIL